MAMRGKPMRTSARGSPLIRSAYAHLSKHAAAGEVAEREHERAGERERES